MAVRPDKNYYEILDVNPSSTDSEIEEAYERIRSIYSGDSDAVYSLHTPEEKARLLDQIEKAHEVLKDPARKREYDDMLFTHDNEQETSEVDIGSLLVDAGAEPEEETVDLGGITGTAKLKKQLVVSNGVDPIVAEQYHILFTKLDHDKAETGHKVYALTSAVKEEGKSVTSLNLAYVMATVFKQKTLLLECDLRKPSTVSEYLDTDDSEGLVHVISGEADLFSTIRRVENTNLYILPTGHNSRKSLELLGSPKLKGIISTLRHSFDYILVDSPPVLPLVDMNIISKVADAVIMVVLAGKTAQNLVVKAVKSLPSETCIVGVVFNCADVELQDYYY